VSGEDDRIAQLRGLERLHTAGLINDAEYERQKARLLGLPATADLPVTQPPVLPAVPPFGSGADETPTTTGYVLRDRRAAASISPAPSGTPPINRAPPPPRPAERLPNATGPPRATINTSLWKVFAAIVAVAVLIVGFANGWGKGNSNGNSSSTSSTQTTTASTLPLNDAGIAVCPAKGGPAGRTGLSGLGASVDEFAAAHPTQDPAHADLYHDAGRLWGVSCSTHGAVVFVNGRLPFAVPAANLKDFRYGPFTAIAPPDAKQIVDVPGNKEFGHACELVTYHSDLLARDTAADDPSGNFMLELLSPVDVVGFDPSRVDELIFDARAKQDVGC